MRHILATSVCALSLVAAASPAEAAYLFTLTTRPDPATTTQTTFTIEDGFTPDASDSSSFSVNVYTQESTDDTISAAMLNTVTFGLARAYPNFSVGRSQYASSVRLFTGTTTAPTGFNLGTFSLGDLQTDGSATLVISSDVAAVPEPATWAMMLMGFGMVAGAARYRRRKSTVTFA